MVKVISTELEFHQLYHHLGGFKDNQSQDWREVWGMVFEILKLNRKHSKVNVTVLL